MKKLYIENCSHLKISLNNYDCDVCKDKGFLLNEKGEYIGRCKCQIRKDAIATLNSSGLKFDSKRYRFDTYNAITPWQKDYKNRTMKFLDNPNSWFVMLGQPGLGKSHLMTALTVQLIGKGKDVEYVKWVEAMLRSKNDYWNIDERFVKRMETVEVLYIDDLFKVDKDQQIHSEENRIAFRVIDARYGNPDLITLISSEKSIYELSKINEGLAGRIVEMCGGLKSQNLIDSKHKDDGNYRLR